MLNSVTMKGLNMANPNEQINSSLTEAEFVSAYGDNLVTLPGVPDNFTVNDALAMESAFCPADPDKRSNEKLRIQQLAKYVGESALLPEHRWLLPEDNK